MTTISRLGIQGIRSYGPDEEQVLLERPEVAGQRRQMRCGCACVQMCGSLERECTVSSRRFCSKCNTKVPAVKLLK